VYISFCFIVLVSTKLSLSFVRARQTFQEAKIHYGDCGVERKPVTISELNLFPTDGLAATNERVQLNPIEELSFLPGKFPTTHKRWFKLVFESIALSPANCLGRVCNLVEKFGEILSRKI
jgi:hypothetical protein